jgi:predicted enzyme related to lactoylglutathione lyase
MKKIWLLGLLIAMCGCASPPKVPSISDSKTWLPGKVVWRDLITPDAALSGKFYSELFGWSFEPVEDSGYSLIRHKGVLIGGMVDADKLGKSPRSSLWLSAISVEDTKAAVDRAKKAGGRVERKSSSIPDRGQAAVIEDVEGALVQIIKTSGGDPVDTEPVMNGWLWTELIADDVAGAAGFYSSVFGYDIKAGPEAAGKDYNVLERDGNPCAGILKSPFENTRSTWIPCVRVKSAQKTAKKAGELGARIIIEPDADVRGGRVALILDPSGAPLILQEWSAPSGKGGKP